MNLLCLGIVRHLKDLMEELSNTIIHQCKIGIIIFTSKFLTAQLGKWRGDLTNLILLWSVKWRSYCLILLMERKYLKYPKLHMYY